MNAISAPSSRQGDGERFAIAHNVLSTAQRLWPFAAMLVIVIASAHIVNWAWTHQVSFDGAVNLQISRSLAEGEGYRRLYEDYSGFSHAVQTRAPFLLPAAAAFALFGVGVWQSQLTNFVYLLAFAIILFTLFRRHVPRPWAMLATAVFLCTPGMLEIGLNGYGEIPAMTWWLAGLLVLYRSAAGEPVPIGRVIAAALLMGIGVVTKTVLLIGVAAALPVWFVYQAGRTRRWLATATIAVAIFAAVLVPALIHELAHAMVLHDLSRLRGWFDKEWLAIQMQSGTERGFADTTNPMAKIARHFGILADAMRLNRTLLGAWMLALATLLAATWRRLPRTSLRPILATLVAFAAIYLVWWLAITPTAKAWHRRIFDGTIALELVSVFALWHAVYTWSAMPARTRWLRGAAAAVVAVTLAASCAASLLDDGDPTWGTRADLADDLSAMTALGPDARLYGIGWYSAPQVTLYSGRHFRDLVAQPSTDLAARSPAYLALDPPAQREGVAGYWLARYPHRDVAVTGDLRLVELDTNRISNPFAASPADTAKLRGYAAFQSADYPYTFGFQAPEGNGWRWATSDAELLLRYSGEPAFKLDIYLPAPSRYRRAGGVHIAVWIDGCRLGVIHQDQEGLMRWWLPMRNCPLAPGAVVRARMVSDNVAKTGDTRQLSFVANGLGFDQE